MNDQIEREAQITTSLSLAKQKLDDRNREPRHSLKMKVFNKLESVLKSGTILDSNERSILIVRLLKKLLTAAIKNPQLHE